MKTTKALAATILLAWTSQAALAQTTQTNPAPKPTFLIVGSFHFQGSTSDMLSNQMTDVPSEKRQKELEAIAEALARFKPTKIAVEAPAGSTKIQELYAATLKGERPLDTDETEQIAFRLAKKLGHERIYPVDHRLDMDFDGVMQAMEKYGQQAYFEQAMGVGKAFVGETQRLVDTSTVGAALRFMNDPRGLDEGHGLYMLMAQVGGPGDPRGAEMVAGWYRRNLLIFSNLVRLIEKPEERVLVVYGAGHAKLLRDAISQSPNLRLEEAVDYLP